MARIQVTFSRNFFSNQSREYSNKINSGRYDINSIDLFTQVGGEISEVIADLKNFDEPFTDRDEREIGRGESYKVSPDLSMPITIDKFKHFLASHGIQNTRLQNLILCLLLQNRVGLPVAFGKFLTSFFMDLMSPPSRKGVPPEPFATASLGEEDPAPTVKFKKNSIMIHITVPIREGRNPAQKIGEGKIDVKINPDGEIELSDLKLTFRDNRRLEENSVTLLKQIDRCEELKKCNIVRPFQPANRFLKYIWNNPWKTAALVGAAALGIIGIGLSLSGIFSPAGILLTALSWTGIKLSLTGTSLLAADALVPAVGGIVGIGVAKGAKKIGQCVTGYQPTETFTFLPASLETLRSSEEVKLAKQLGKATHDMADHPLPTSEEIQESRIESQAEHLFGLEQHAVDEREEEIESPERRTPVRNGSSGRS